MRYEQAIEEIKAGGLDSLVEKKCRFMGMEYAVQKVFPIPSDPTQLTLFLDRFETKPYTEAIAGLKDSEVHIALLCTESPDGLENYFLPLHQVEIL
jgi:hypothetical protein